MWLGRENEAHRYAEKLIEIKPNFSLDSYKEGLKYKDAAYVERLLEALRKAGLPKNPPLALPDKPSIAVLPFANMSDDPKQEYFVDGMTDDLITDLSKISGLFVIARNSTFAYKGKSPDVRQVSRELGVKYVLEGSVRRAGEQVRINAQLIDATTGGHVWAERYDGSLANVFTMQDEVTQKIVTALAVNLTTEEKAARAQQETDSPEAYDAFLRGRAHYNFFSPDDLAKAIPYLEKAIQLEPNYARAHGVLAALYWYVGDSGWAQSMGMSYDDTLKKMEHHLKEALKNPTPLAHHIASQFLTSQGRNDEALAEAKRAVALDPNDATGYIAMAKVYNNTGRPAEGLEAMKKSMRLDPQGDVVGDISSRLGESYFHRDRFEEAAAAYKKAQERSPDDEWRLLYLATTYGHLERKQEAQSALEKFNNARAKKGRRPYTLAAMMDGWQFADETIRERFREGLRKAGVPPGAPSPPLAFRGVMKAPLEIAGATTIDVTEAKALFDRGVPFVDVRGDPGWKRGHISGAVHLHVYHDVTEAKLSKVAAKDEEVVIYAHGPGAGVSTRAVASAVSMGFKKVYFFREGLPGWKAAGYPVEAPSG
jgi:TolB-like protein/rhodanese-related sulfurtransferase/thioredoxin-like negative regulator of GroEL